MPQARDGLKLAMPAQKKTGAGGGNSDSAAGLPPPVTITQQGGAGAAAETHKLPLHYGTLVSLLQVSGFWKPGCICGMVVCRVWVDPTPPPDCQPSIHPSTTQTRLTKPMLFFFQKTKHPTDQNR